LVGLRLRFAIACFNEGWRGFEHLRNSYLKGGKEVDLEEAMQQLYSEGAISLYNVHVRNVIFDLLEASRNPRISWRQKEDHGSVRFLISISNKQYR
jgi:hypothetical protein